MIALAVVIYKWATKNNDFFAKQGIPYLKPKFLIGSSGRFSGKQSAQDNIIDHYNQFPESKYVQTLISKFILFQKDDFFTDYLDFLIFLIQYT